MRVLVAIEPVDGRKGIDSLAQLCRDKLNEDPFSGCLFLFRTKSLVSIRALVYDGQGYWIAQKRLSRGSYRCWPTGEGGCTLESHQVQMLLAGVYPSAPGAPIWRQVRPPVKTVQGGTCSGGETLTMASKKKRKPPGQAFDRPSLTPEMCDQLEQHLVAMQEAANSSELSEEERRRAMLKALASFTQVHFDLKGEPMSPEIQQALGIGSD